MIFDAEYHRKKVRELAQEPPDEPTYCELKRELGYATNAEKAKLAKDVVSIANTPLEHHGGFRYLIFGVAQDGSIPSVLTHSGGDPPSQIRDLLNRYLERPVAFEFITTHVEDGCRKKHLAAVVVPNSRRRPHVISRDLQEQQGKKTRFLLRKGEVWVRKAGGRQLATAEDIHAMYEAKLLSVASSEYNLAQEGAPWDWSARRFPDKAMSSVTWFSEEIVGSEDGYDAVTQDPWGHFHHDVD